MGVTTKILVHWGKGQKALTALVCSLVLSAKRTLAGRTKEHPRAVRVADTRRYETADHCWKYNHDFD